MDPLCTGLEPAGPKLPLSMNIQTWLSSTEFQHSPEAQEPTVPGYAAYKVPQEQSRKECRRSPDSSKIESQTRRPGAEGRHHRRTHSRGSKSRATSSRSSGSLSSSESSSVHASKERFERRPRRKTRDDLYEPHSGARRRRGRRDDSNGKKRKKSKASRGHHDYRRTKRARKAKERPGQTLLRQFHADNVPSERLTVGKPAFVG